MCADWPGSKVTAPSDQPQWPGQKAATPAPSVTIKEAPPGALAQAVAPVLDVPREYSKEVHAAVNSMRHGYNRLTGKDESLGERAAGAGEAALGGMNYVSAPITAPVHSLVGKPTANVVGAATGSERAGRFAGDTADLATELFIPIPKGLTPARATEAAALPSIEELKSAAKAGFESPEIKDLTFRPEAMKQGGELIQLKLTEQGIPEELAPKTWAILKKLDNPPSGSTMTGQGLQTLRRTLGKAAADADPTERLAAKEAIDAVDAFMAHIPPNAVLSGDPAKASQIWGNARANYASAMHAQTIREAVDKAKNRAGSTYSGGNIDNATRQEVRKILDSPKKARGFTPEETAQMRHIDRGNYVGDAPRAIGNLTGGGGGFPSVIAAGAGAAAAGPMGAALPLIGYGFRKLGNIITANRVAKLDQMIRGRSPLAAETRGSIETYGATAQAFEHDPSVEHLARLITAASDLAESLKSAGISTSAKDLIKAAQTPDDHHDTPAWLTYAPGKNPAHPPVEE